MKKKKKINNAMKNMKPFLFFIIILLHYSPSESNIKEIKNTSIAASAGRVPFHQTKTRSNILPSTFYRITRRSSFIPFLKINTSSSGINSRQVKERLSCLWPLECPWSLLLPVNCQKGERQQQREKRNHLRIIKKQRLIRQEPDSAQIITGCSGAFGSVI